MVLLLNILFGIVEFSFAQLTILVIFHDIKQMLFDLFLTVLTLHFLALR